MNAIELFCGAGGTSLGLQQAGFRICGGLDFEPNAIETFSANFPNAAAICDSVENVSGEQLLKAAGLKTLDVLLGGPSCQGYSTMGKRIEEDPRNFLFSHYIRLVREMRPRWILFENVRGMLLFGKGRFISALVDELAEMGYSCCYGVLNCADFGIPQRRERFFLIGTLNRFTPTFPSPTHDDPRCAICARPDGSKRVRYSVRNHNDPALFPSMPCSRCGGTGFEPAQLLRLRPWVSVWDAIGDLAQIGDEGGSSEVQSYDQPAFSAYQKVMRNGARGYDLHIAKSVSELAKEVISKVQEGNGLRSIPDDELPDRFKIMRKVSSGKLRRDCTTLYFRLARNLPSYTITCSFTNVASGAFVHPLHDRAITPREAARLQSFPDAFKFHHSKIKTQLGNAVPPLMAEILGRHILEMGARRDRVVKKKIKNADQSSSPKSASQGRLL